MSDAYSRPSIIDTSLPLTEENIQIYRLIKSALQDARLKLLPLVKGHDRATCKCTPCDMLRDIDPSYIAITIKLIDDK